MTPDEPPGVSWQVALVLVGVLGILFAFGLVVASLVSVRFQRYQDRRWADPHVTRFEWMRINAGIWARHVADIVRRRAS